MDEYEVVWRQSPFIHYPPQVTFVEAATAEDAKELVRDYVKRRHGYYNFSITQCQISTPAPQGKIKE